MSRLVGEEVVVEEEEEEVSDTCELTELDRQQVGNGWCEDSSNIDSCGWDGGDCCISTCKTTKCTFGRMCCQTFECINPSINMTAEVMATRQARFISRRSTLRLTR